MELASIFDRFSLAFNNNNFGKNNFLLNCSLIVSASNRKNYKKKKIKYDKHKNNNKYKNKIKNKNKIKIKKIRIK